jgi:hypothetical protein
MVAWEVCLPTALKTAVPCLPEEDLENLYHAPHTEQGNGENFRVLRPPPELSVSLEPRTLPLPSPQALCPSP